jgi:anti-sigma regulatory factor (Ser/Thr protein kinase)
MEDWTPQRYPEKILILDTHPEVCAFLQELLEKNTRCQLFFTRTFEEALVCLQKETPVLFLLDSLLLAGESADSCYKQIQRLSPKTSLILLIDCSSSLAPLPQLPHFQEVFSSWILKPLEAPRVLEVIYSVLTPLLSRLKKEKVYGTFKREVKEFVLSNHDSSTLHELIQELNEHFVLSGFCTENQLPQFALVLTEAITNAIEHGNLELSSELKKEGMGKNSPFIKLKTERLQDPLYSQRRVFISMELNPEGLTYRIRDEGKGFDYRHIKDPRDPQNLWKLHGRGLALIYKQMDQILFNETGNEIIMFKTWPPPTPPPNPGAS